MVEGPELEGLGKTDFIREGDGATGCVRARGVETIPRAAVIPIFEDSMTISIQFFSLSSPPPPSRICTALYTYIKSAFPVTISFVLKNMLP